MQRTLLCTQSIHDEYSGGRTIAMVSHLAMEIPENAKHHLTLYQHREEGPQRRQQCPVLSVYETRKKAQKNPQNTHTILSYSQQVERSTIKRVSISPVHSKQHNNNDNNSN
jgi:hypothetical protein